GVSFSIPSDKKTAIVGPTGSGKSSILSLLLKFVLPDEGIITISGSDLRSIDSTWWRKQVAWVPQFPYLFNDTIAANLMMANPDASNEEIIIASKQAYLHDFIISLPDGYSTQIGERGARLSGGQAQRLALARAFLKDAPILIFDEPTKNLDPQTQELVDEMVNRLVGEKTIVIVAHRLSSVRTADQVIVLEDGKIVQVGKHAELIERDGIYRKLVFQKDPAT
ncbi:MAG: ATP-binding cassette domain-containing protein, partial [Aliifodinibius sp.]|nr:ATP-binding cassette domain-containing protein [Fodinibius sp.]